MTTYEITPETEIIGHDISKSVNTSTSKCRRLCNDTWQCEAFVWYDHDEGTCVLKDSSLVDTSWNNHATLYIKKGNSNYWLLWVFLALLGVVLFISLCKRKN